MIHGVSSGYIYLLIWDEAAACLRVGFIQQLSPLTVEVDGAAVVGHDTTAAAVGIGLKVGQGLEGNCEGLGGGGRFGKESLQGADRREIRLGEVGRKNSLKQD